MTYPPQTGAPFPGQPGPPQPQHPTYPQPPYQQPYPQPHQTPYQQPFPGQQLPPQGWGGAPGWGGPGGPPQRGGAGRKPACLGVVLVVLVGVVVGGVVLVNANRKRMPVSPMAAESGKWQKVADVLTQALAAKDEEAFVKPFAGPAKEKQRLVFRNLLKIPWETARWEAPVAPMNGQLWVDFVHQVKGVDNLPITERYGWQVLPVDSGTEVVTDVGGIKGSEGKDLGFGYYPAPWDLYDDLTVQVRDHLVAMAGKDQAAELNRDVDVLARTAKDDLAAWQKYAPAPVGDRKGASGFFVVLEKNRDVYNKLYKGDGKANDSLEAGVNMPMRASDQSKAGPDEMLIGGSRIVMDTTGSRFTSSQWQDGVTDIGRHEMAHAIVAPLLTAQPEFDGTGNPRDWVAEGFGEYMALRGRDSLARDEMAAYLQDVRFNGELPGDGAEFYSSDGKQRSANYTLAGDALRFMGSKYGDAKVFSFVAAQYGRPKEYEQQITAATGQSPAQFQSAWAAHVRAVAPKH
ncbi:hypothetical protein [Streptomyces sp. TLI_171]|uniref:hypothetical protein n=1 Tax=Streptomyces sp. TLI_171 TaxID=1938859 RepID=UPI000C19B3D8|nr:hypothetical protein [Streptomyces sp. TLI_171]RKE19289.1 hypothetical protein BX266_2607 [Streptomyces sp. TLI_171]